MIEESRDISSLVWHALRLGIENASRKEATQWLPWVLDSLLAEEAENDSAFKARLKESEEAEDQVQQHWGLVGAYVQAAKDSGYLRPIIREADPEALELLAGGAFGEA